MFDVGIVGVGAWARHLIDSVQGSSAKIRFTAAHTRTPSKIEDFAAERSIRIAADFAELINDPSLNGIVVAVPAGLHAEHARAALEAGKHVMVIKPLALHRAEAEAMYRIAGDKGLLLAMGYDRCFLPAADALRGLVRDGRLGRIVAAEGNFCVDRYLSMKPGTWKISADHVSPGALADHMMYMMIELIGPVEEVCARGANLVVDATVPDVATVTVRLKGGAIATLNSSGITANFHRLHFFGTEGWAEIRADSHLEFQPAKGEREVTDFSTSGLLTRQLETFAAAALGEADYPIPPEDAINGVAALEAMTRSYASGRPETI